MLTGEISKEPTTENLTVTRLLSKSLRWATSVLCSLLGPTVLGPSSKNVQSVKLDLLWKIVAPEWIYKYDFKYILFIIILSKTFCNTFSVNLVYRIDI